MTDDLVQFLLDRLDEDERVARTVGFDRIETGEYMWNSKYLLLQGGDGGESKATAEFDGDLAEHIARHDPARVLREVEAKRQIVKAHGRAALRSGGGAKHFDTATVCRSCEPDHQFPELSWPCPTLRLLALPYADHPDYRQEWKP